MRWYRQAQNFDYRLNPPETGPSRSLERHIDSEAKEAAYAVSSGLVSGIEPGDYELAYEVNLPGSPNKARIVYSYDDYEQKGSWLLLVNFPEFGPEYYEEAGSFLYFNEALDAVAEHVGMEPGGPAAEPPVSDPSPETPPLA